MTLDCHSFEALLEEFLDGKLRGAGRRSADEHLRSCARCRDLLQMLDACVEPPDDLAEGVLRATTGRTCVSARTGLCDLVDGALGGVDAELVRMHLRDCADCASLEPVLVALCEDLPSLAQRMPDERFVDDVLARTLPLRSRLIRQVARWAVAWRRVVRRPRFAWESAYVLTALLVLVLGVHDWPLAGVPKQAYDAATVDLPTRLEPQLSKLGSTVSFRARAAWDSTGRPLADDARAVMDDVSRLSDSVLQQVKVEVGTFWSRLASQQENDDDNKPSKNDEDGREGDET